MGKKQSSRNSKKGPGVNDQKKFKSLKELYAEAKASKVSTKRKTRADDHVDMEMIQPSKKTFKVSGTAKKTLQRTQDANGDNGCKNDEKVQREHHDGLEVKEDCINNNGDTRASDLEKKRIYSKKPKPCKSKDVNRLHVSDVGSIPTSSGIEARKDGVESMETNCFMMEKNQKNQNQEEHIASIERCSEVFGFPRASNNPSDTNGNMQNAHKDATTHEENSLHVNCLGKQAALPIETTSSGTKASDLKKKCIHSKKPKPCKSKDVNRLHVSDVGSIPTSSGTETRKNGVESMETNCSMMEKNQKNQNQEERITSIEHCSEVFGFPGASNNPSDTNDNMRNSHKDATTHEENLLHVKCVGKQAAQPMQTNSSGTRASDLEKKRIYSRKPKPCKSKNVDRLHVSDVGSIPTSSGTETRKDGVESMEKNCSMMEKNQKNQNQEEHIASIDHHSEVFGFPGASNNPSDTNDNIRNSHKDSITYEENSLHVKCLGKQAAQPIQANNETTVLRYSRKNKKKCDKLMKRLVDKQLEEVKEMNKKWEEKKAELKNNCRKELTAISSLQNKSLIGIDKLRILDDTYTKKSIDLESQILALREELQARHRSEIDELQKEATWLLKQVKSYAQKELSNNLTSDNKQLPVVENLELTELSNETSIAGKHQDQNSKSGTTGVLSHIDDTGIDSSEAIVIPNVVEFDNLVLKDSPEHSLGYAEKSSSLALEADQVRSAELMASPGICSINHPQINIASVCPSDDNQDQNSKSETAGVLSHVNDAVVDSSEPEVVESDNAVLKDSSEQSLDCAEKSSSIALKADQVDENNTLLSCRTAELLASPGICSIDHPQIAVASVCPSSDDQGLEIEDCERAVGLEEQVRLTSEPSPSNLLCDEYRSGVSDVTPSQDYHRERDASGGSLNNEPCEFYTSDVTTIQREPNSDVLIPGEAGSQHIAAFAVDPAAEPLPSTTRNTFSPQVSPPNLSQWPTFSISQLPFLSSNPLRNELERTRWEIYQIMNFHEETKSRLKAECDKEIEEVAAQIRVKYDEKLKEADASFSSKRNELEMYHNKVMIHNYLAEAFGSEFFSKKATSEMQQVRFMNPYSGSVPRNIVPAVRVVHPCATVSNPTARSLHINTVAQTSPHEAVRRYARSHILESSYGSASTPVPSNCMPCVPRSSSGQWAQQPPIRAQCYPSAPFQLPQDPTPFQLPQDPTPSLRISKGRSHFNLNSYISAMDLFIDGGRSRNNANHTNNAAPLTNNTLRTSESLDASASRATAERISNNVASMPNDMQALESVNALALKLPSSTSCEAMSEVVCLSDDE